MTAPGAKTDGLAIYMRVSTDEQKHQGTIETQRAAADRYLALHDITPYGRYADDGVSGTLPFASRPEGARLLADAAAGAVRTLVCWRLDRIGRNALAILQVVETLERLGVRLFSITESFDTTTPAGRLQLNMLATIAQFERDSIIQRSSEGMARRLETTTWMGGHAPFGYHIEGKRGTARLAICDTPDAGSGYSESDVVGLAWHLLIEQDWPCERIAEYLEQLGIPTRTGRSAWAPNVVYQILTNPVYKGERPYHQKDGQVIIQSAPALVSVEQWDRAPGHARASQALAYTLRSARLSLTRSYALRALWRALHHKLDAQV